MKILLVDDHAAFRLGMCGMVREFAPSAEIIEANTAAEALNFIEYDPAADVIFLDLDLPDRSGFDLLAQIRAKAPRSAIAILSAYDDPPLVRQALKLGAMAYISKKYPIEKFRKVLSQVLNGQPHVVSSFSQSSTASGQSSESLFFPAQLKPMVEGDVLSGRRELTEREQQVLRFLIQGWSNNDICDALEMKEGTVKTHINSIYRKLRVTSRAGVIIAVERMGITL